MSTQAEHPCSVCDRKTKTTCGGCRVVYFCDRSCQAAIWSTHKWLCKNSPDMFTFPALTTDEAATLKQLVGDSNPIVKTAMKRIKLRERDGWQSGKALSTTSHALTAPYLNPAAHSASSSCTSSCATSKPARSRPP
ncbi:RHTO0S07e00122g1_1 [Rhodotorula toruloides]|uniref:RHTO0S07e00122g1_1 n=1 Tax=Rhodotorula toruloides TaxID=5286 RepID=A0A061AZ80_RHOTO|nr:RHTO0S07e00122g1_1 [Rhodotorula toruloides]